MNWLTGNWFTGYRLYRRAWLLESRMCELLPEECERSMQSARVKTTFERVESTCERVEATCER